MKFSFLQSLLKLSKKNVTKFKKTTRTKRTTTTTIIPSKTNDNVATSSSSSESAEFIAGNQDLLDVIFSKLDDKHRHRCKTVCKTWYEFISGRRFVYHYKLPPPSALLIRRYTRRRRRPRAPLPEIKYLTVPLETKTTPPPPSSLSSSSQPPSGIRISQSCNGLLLCRAGADDDPQRKNTANVEHYVYNPTTGDSRLIPLPTTNHAIIEVKSMTLAFDPTQSPPHYKIISVCTLQRTYVSSTRLHIYSSETRLWRQSKAELPAKSHCVDFSKGVFLNGRIHWPSPKGPTSVSFDVENERFETIPMPPVQESGGSRRTIRYFGEAGGKLLMIDSGEESPARFTVLQMAEDYSGWVVRYKVRLSWYFGWRVEKYRILSVICDGGEDLAVVIYCPGRDRSGKGLMTFNPRTGRLNKIHSPVGGWDLKLLVEKGYSVVHPFFRTKFQV